jgi:hypothetical protein
MQAGAQKNFSKKIQWIYNGKCAPITTQALAQAVENPPAQEQWKTMKKQCAEQFQTIRSQASPQASRRAQAAATRAGAAADNSGASANEDARR